MNPEMHSLTLDAEIPWQRPDFAVVGNQCAFPWISRIETLVDGGKNLVKAAHVAAGKWIPIRSRAEIRPVRLEQDLFIRFFIENTLDLRAASRQHGYRDGLTFHPDSIYIFVRRFRDDCHLHNRLNGSGSNFRSATWHPRV